MTINNNMKYGNGYVTSYKLYDRYNNIYYTCDERTDGKKIIMINYYKNNEISVNIRN